ncbi:hypothetical protein JCM19992_10980 [Thermostilla marina]
MTALDCFIEDRQTVPNTSYQPNPVAAFVPSVGERNRVALMVLLLCGVFTGSTEIRSAAAVPRDTDSTPSVETPADPGEDARRALLLFSLGSSYENEKRYLEAVSCFRQANVFAPNSPTVITAAVNAALRSGLRDEAAERIAAAVLMTDFEPPREWLRFAARYLAQRGEDPLAAAVYRRLVANLTCEDQEEVEAVETLCRLACSLYALGKVDEAADAFEQARSIAATCLSEGRDTERKATLAAVRHVWPAVPCLLAAERDDAVPLWFRLVDAIPDDHARYAIPEALCTAARLQWLWEQGKTEAATASLCAEVEAGRPIAKEVLDVIASLSEPQARRLSAALEARARENPAERSTFFLRLEAALRSDDEITATRLLHDGWPTMMAGIDPVTRKPGVWFREAWKDVLQDESDQIASDPAVALVWLTAVDGENDRTDRAIACLLRESRDYSIPAAVARLLESRERWADAARCYALAAQCIDDSANVLRLSLALNAARCWNASGEYGRAQELIDQLRRSLPTLDDAQREHIELSITATEASLAAAEGDMQRAVQLWMLAWKGCKRATVDRLTRREIGLASAGLLLSTGRRREAERILLDLVAEFPTCDRALNDLGYLWTEERRHLATAEILLRRAVLLVPDRAAYRDSLGYLLYVNGHVDEAIAQLEQAVAIAEDPAILDHLGDAYAAAGRIEDALRVWTRAAEVCEHENDNSKRLSLRKKIDKWQADAPKRDGGR